MKTLSVVPFSLKNLAPQDASNKIQDAEFLYKLPSDVCFSYKAATEILTQNRFSYDILITTYTPDLLLPESDLVGDLKNRYTSAQQHVSIILKENPFAIVILWTGATPTHVITDVGFDQRVHVFNRSILSDNEVRTEIEETNLRTMIADALTEYRLSLNDEGDFRIEPVCGRAPINIVGEEASLFLPVRPYFCRAFGKVECLVKELEYLINKTSVSEREIELFLRSHPYFLFGNRYKSVKWQVHLKRTLEGRGVLIPDVILEPVSPNDFWKIQDLKLPSLKITRSSGTDRQGFNSHVLSAMHQLREYRDYFDNPTYRQQLAELGITAYKPELSVLIGRDYGGLSTDQIIKAKGDFKDLEVMTYSELLSQIRNNFSWMEHVIHSTLERNKMGF